ncbi:MAG TPA: urate hydroxylase PuuD [Longimicrobiales bacterium]|nr:urate hydroxylase PuuD [Longimicrobiales bacterium]
MRELLDLTFRWIHVIAAIMWIGNSLLYNWLDRSLRPSRDPRDVEGDAWLIHSGGFYHVEKRRRLDELPRPLHWFKWQAYTTWLSGAALLVVVYYLGGRALLLGPGATMSDGAAIATSAGILLGSWLAYEALWRSPLSGAPGLASGLSLALVAAVGFALTQVFGGRAAFLHLGAVMGTLMAGNVATAIMPAQRSLVRSVEEGGQPDPRLSTAAKERSVHNNYMAFPVIVLMLSSHFPGLYGHRWNWLVLAVLVAGGVAVRHALNLRFQSPRWLAALAASLAGALAALYVLGALFAGARGSVPGTADGGPVTFEAVRHVIAKRCTPCHSVSPAIAEFGASPAGVAFDTDEQIRALAERIRERAVVTETMPPGNATHLTAAERDVLRRWTGAVAR